MDAGTIFFTGAAVALVMLFVLVRRVDAIASETAAIRRILSATLESGFGRETDLQRMTGALETLVRWESKKQPPLAPPL